MRKLILLIGLLVAACSSDGKDPCVGLCCEGSCPQHYSCAPSNGQCYLLGADARTPDAG
jgi:hypothetical protein